MEGFRRAEHPAGDPARRSGRRAAAALVVAAICSGTVTAAHAQDDPLAPVKHVVDDALAPADEILQEPEQACEAAGDPEACRAALNTPRDPGQACHDATQLDVGCDTTYTPVAKDGHSIGWSQVGGAVFPGADAHGYKEEGSPTPVTADFYTVAFQNPDRGFAGGAQCADDPPPGIEGAVLDDHLEQCERVPVILHFRSEDFPQWQEVYRGDSPGFVGAITWFLGTDRALAVGGDGCYPRREWPWKCPGETDPPPCQQRRIFSRGRVAPGISPARTQLGRRSRSRRRCRA